MHTLLAHAYHLAQYGLHVLLLPLWHAPLAAGAITAAGRLLGRAKTPRGTAQLACAAVFTGWLLLDPGWAAWPEPPVGRLPGLALILWLAAGFAQPGPVSPAALGTAALTAWWLRGTPFDVVGILYCMPVFVGLAIALPLARFLVCVGGASEGGTGGQSGAHDGHGGVRDAASWGNVAASLVLAGGLMLSGASVHWARAALIPGVVAAVLPGLAEAGSGLIVLVAACALVASDRGRVLAVDLACVSPLLVWAALRLRGRRQAGLKRTE